MNLKNVQRVRDHLEQLIKDKNQSQFNMSHLVEYIKDTREDEERSPFIAMKEGACNTSACICGWAAVLLGTKEELKGYEDSGSGNSIWALGQEKLGLTDAEANELFAPWETLDEDKYFDDRLWEIEGASLQQAILVLEHILETGEIDWNVAF